MNTKSALEGVQQIYIKVLTVVLVVLATIALISSIALLLWAGIKFLDTPKPVEPTRTVPAVSVSLENFVALAKRGDKASATKTEIGPGVKSSSSPLQRDPVEVLLENQIQKLWSYYYRYQLTCKVQNATTEKMFDEAFPRVLVKDWLRSGGPTFASAQDEFIKSVLANNTILEICRNSQGRIGIFPTALDWHKSEWDKQRKSVESMEESERRRVASEERSRTMQIQLSRENGMKILTLSAAGFGVFMSIVITLIFAKIEYNLRKLKSAFPRD